MAKRSPVSAGFLLQVCKQALKYCRKRRYAISNVLDDMVVGDVGKKAEVSERVLTNKELGNYSAPRMTKYSRHTTAP